MRRLTATILGLVLFCLSLPMASAGTIDLSGTWTWTDVAQDNVSYTGPATIVHNVQAGTFTWAWDSNWTQNGTPLSAHVEGTGSILGRDISLDAAKNTAGEFTAHFILTVSSNANTITGTWTQNDGQSGTANATRQSAISNTECTDGADNDSDGTTDLDDEGCTAQSDTDEANPSYANLSVTAGVYTPGSTQPTYDQFEIRQGKRFILEVTVTNLGPDTAELVQTPIRLGDNFTVEDPHAVATCAYAFVGASCEWDSLAANETVTGQVRLIPAEVGTHDLIVDVTSESSDTVSTNNRSTISTTVLPGGADLKVSASGPKEASNAHPFTWTFTIRNEGPQRARGIKLHLGTAYEGPDVKVELRDISREAVCDKDHGQRWVVDCSIGSLASDAVAKVRFTWRVTTQQRYWHSGLGTVSTRTDDPRSRNNRETQSTLLRGFS